MLFCKLPGIGRHNEKEDILKRILDQNSFQYIFFKILVLRKKKQLIIRAE